MATPRRIVRAAPAAPAVKTPAPAPTPEPKPSKAFHEADREDAANRVDYVAVIQRYRDKVNSRGSAIRAHCVQCSGGSLAEVRDCAIKTCALYDYRMGTDPFNAKTLKAQAKKQGNPHEEEES